MVKLSLSKTLVMLLFFLISIEEFIDTQARRDILLHVNNDALPIKNTKKPLDKDVIVGDANGKKWLRGRNMISVLEAEEEVAVVAAADHSAGKCRHGGDRKLSSGCEVKKRVLPNGHHHFGGFTPFSSDYHLPNYHPPKNN